jgi:hypothetical protein
MDPQVVTADQWAEISRLLIYLSLFTGLGLTSALGFLLGHAIIPSLIASHDAPPALGSLRLLAYPIAAAALLLTAYALARALALAADLVPRIYPRLWI